MDMGDDVKFTLDIKSNLFRDVTKITSNNTYTINLPKTVHNMSAIDWAAKPKSGSRYPYAFHKAQYFRNGLEIIKNGRATLMSIEDNIEISIYWGLFPAFTALSENGLKLNELETEEHVLFNKFNQPNTKEEAMSKGVFYAYYNPYQIVSTEDGYGVTFTRNHPDTNFAQVFKAGKIKTGSKVGAYIGGLVKGDSDWHCMIVPFYPTMTANVDCYGTGDYRGYAVLDKNKMVIKIAPDMKGVAKRSYSIVASAKAAFLVVNIKNEAASGEDGQLNAQVNFRGAEKMRELHDTWNNWEDYSGDDFNNPDVSPPFYLQPCVTVPWILNLVKQQAKVDFDFGNDVSAFVVPIINNKADDKTIVGELSASILPATEYGSLSFDLKNTLTSVNEGTKSNASQFSVKTDCTLTFDIQLRETRYAPNFNSWIDNPDFVKMKVVSLHDSDASEDSYTETYEFGNGHTADGSMNFFLYWGVDRIDGKLYDLVAGSKKIDLKAGDIVSFEIANLFTSYKPNVYGGTIKATIEIGDEVPFGGYFPIGINLPDMSVLDFVKFLSLATGKFPRQLSDDGKISFVSYDIIWNNRSKATDWTRKLIPKDGGNTPRKAEFAQSDFKQHNYYKWKEDEQTHTENDADLIVDNGTLDYEQDVWTLPFAASDGNRIPIRTYDGIGAKDGGQYNGCKDRIMTLRDIEVASLEFGIDLQDVFATKYARLAKTLSSAHIVTEWLNLSDLDILNFDETVPVYFAQYGAYFAVTELKTTSNGYTEATMLQLEF